MSHAVDRHPGSPTARRRRGRLIGDHGAVRSMRSVVARRAVVAVVAAIGLNACGGSDDAAPPSSLATQSSDVPAALRFTAPLLGGGELDGAALADRAVMLWFWAPT
jgi:hypothetical protein